MKRNPFIVRSIKDAFREFMHAPATGGHITNELLVGTVLGAKGSHAPDRATFDGVRMKYGRKGGSVIDTFEKAFYACWRGQRDWREFDIETLRGTWPEFEHLGLPERVESALADEALAEYYSEA